MIVEPGYWEFLQATALVASVALNLWCACVLHDASKLINKTRSLLASLVAEDDCGPEAGGGGA